MKIIKYKATSVPPSNLLSMIKSKYGSEKNFDFFLADFLKSYNFCVDNPNVTFIPFSAIENKELVAHIALIIDKRLGKSEAFFGFFESKEDVALIKSMWNSLVKEAKRLGISTLKGPVNGSVWHQYRCIKETDGSEYFKTEPMSEVYYYKLLTILKPVSEVLYYSASRKKFDKVMGIIEARFKTLAEVGFHIQEVTNVNYEQLRNIAEISRIVFSKNSWGYTDLTEKEFLQLYSSDKLKQHLNRLYLLYKDKQIIGYCGVTIENANTLILKTICILPEYQGLGLGNALAYKVHLNTQKEGFRKVIYALIREGNKVKNFPKDDTVVFRRYAAFKYKI